LLGLPAFQLSVCESVTS